MTRAPGTIVACYFQGVHTAKTRPAIVVSTRDYHTARPDVILALITAKLSAPTASTDYILQDWNQAGLHQPSAFRAFLETHPASAIQFEIGKLSDRDWLEVQARLRLAIAVA